jgi:dihydrofolate reductase
VAEVETVFVIGGADIYRQALALADRLELTELDLEPEGDAWFPEFSPDDWQETAARALTSGPFGGRFVTYRANRKSVPVGS